MSEDNSDIAFLAALTEREMRQKLAGGSGLKYNRTDFRQFLQNGQPRPMSHPQQLPQQYHQQLPQQYYPPSDPYQVPDGVIPPANPQLLPMPPQYSQPSTIQGMQIQPSSPESYAGFNMPDYSGKQQESQKQYLEDEAQFRAALIKEVKSLKNTIKDLKKQVSSLILDLSPIIKSLQTTNPLETKIDETPDNSKGIHSELCQPD